MGSMIKRVLVIAAILPLSGCAAQMLQGAQNDCNAYGFRPGTDEFANCVQRDFEARRANVQRTMASVGQQVATPPSDNGYSGSGVTAYLRSQEVSGTSRICVYNKLGSPYVMTIGAAEMCPITVER